MTATNAPVSPRVARHEPAPPAPPPAPAPAPLPPPAPEHHADDLPRDLRQPGLITVMAVGLLFLALLAGLFFLGYLPHVQAQREAQRQAEIASRDENTVAVIRPRSAVGDKQVVLPCDIRPNQDTLIFARTSGYLKVLHKDIQDPVKKDELLAEISAPEVDAQLVQAQAALGQSQAEVAKAKTDLELAERSYNRFQTADTDGGQLSRQEIDERATARDQARAAVDQATANVAAAQANIERLQVMQGFEKITAPFDGVITARNYDVGALLSPGGGREIFRLQQSNPLRVYVNVPQVYATQIHTGQAATLTVRNFQHRTFQGTVTRNAGAISPNTRTMPFELIFPNPDGALVPGMYGEASLSLDSPPQALLVPVSAMLFNATGTQVAIVQSGKVHFQSVVVGRDLGTDLEILDGLTPATQVITNPSERLVEGSPVDVAQNPAPAGGASKP